MKGKKSKMSKLCWII